MNQVESVKPTTSPTTALLVLFDVSTCHVFADFTSEWRRRELTMKFIDKSWLFSADISKFRMSWITDCLPIEMSKATRYNDDIPALSLVNWHFSEDLYIQIPDLSCVVRLFFIFHDTTCCALECTSCNSAYSKSSNIVIVAASEEICSFEAARLLDQDMGHSVQQSYQAEVLY